MIQNNEEISPSLETRDQFFLPDPVEQKMNKPSKNFVNSVQTVNANQNESVDS
jgi:hypothetical protein